MQFFAFFGFIFVILQYVQFVLGYSPLRPGLALIPMAVLVMGLSTQVPRPLARSGPGRVGPIGLLLMAGGFAVMSTAGGGSSYWLLLAGLALLGSGTALATTPATTAIVASLPAEKQGVASAVNDLTREVGRALGIAVLGSALIDRDAAGISGAVATFRPRSPVPPSRRSRPRERSLTSSARKAHRSQPTRSRHSSMGLESRDADRSGSAAVTALFVFWRAPGKVVTAAIRRRAISRTERPSSG